MAEGKYNNDLLDLKFKASVIFNDDGKRLLHNFATQTKYKLASIAQEIVAIVVAPFTLFGEIYRACKGEINARTCLINIALIPVRVCVLIGYLLINIAKSINGIASAISGGVGFLVWHAGEAIVNRIKGTENIVLSSDLQIRNIVYHAIGVTLLAGVLALIPCPPVQMVALPIILGSIYGAINNQFTVRECPEYYTMGHYYDGTSLRGHAIKTNNKFIKPIVTGCYATTMITKIAGVVLAAAATIPFTAAILPVSIAAALIGGLFALTILVAHICASAAKNKIQKTLNEYGKLINLEWNDENRNKTWGALYELRKEKIEAKKQELAEDAQKLEEFKKELIKLERVIDNHSRISNGDVPIKYLTGWHANNTRNSIGYFMGGGGAAAIVIATIVLRFFAF